MTLNLPLYFCTHGFSIAEYKMCLKECSERYGAKESDIISILKDEVENVLGYMERLDLISPLREVYVSGYTFPEWSEEVLRQRKDLKIQSAVYFPVKYTSQLSLIRRLCIQREPVNIGGRRYYDREKLQKLLGYTESLYAIRDDLPNIAIMCRTPVGGPSGVEVNIINVIGAALDNTRNYDYRYFVEDRSVQSRIQLLQSFYEEIFRKIYVCAEDHGFRTICLPLFGAASFADLYPGGSNSFKYEVWFPVFRKMRELHSKFRILFMGTQGYSVYLSDEMKEEFPDVGYFPEMISKIDPNDTLIVNAWDPYSFVGNGNSGDNSLDGYIGRETACAMLCWPLANPYMRFVGI